MVLERLRPKEQVPTLEILDLLSSPSIDTVFGLMDGYDIKSRISSVGT